MTTAFSGSGRISFSGVICETQIAELMQQSQRVHSKAMIQGLICKLTAPTFFRAAVMDIAGVESSETHRAGAFAGGSAWEGLGCVRGLSEVVDTATDAAPFPAVMPTFTARAASFHNTQYQDYTVFKQMHQYHQVIALTKQIEGETQKCLHDLPKLSSLSRALLFSSSLVAL